MASKNDEILTDDYVAELLASDAKDCSLRYSAMGLEGYNSSSRPTNKSKPNTRFLRHIIKSTTNHNAALLAKEAAESQARLQELAEAEEKKRRKNNPEPKDVRRRQLGDIAAILSGGRKSRRDKDESGKGRSSEPKEKGDKSRDGETSSRLHRRDRDRSRSPHRSSRGDRRDRRSEVDEERSHARHRRRHDTSDGEDAHRSSRRRRDRSRSPDARPSKHRQRSPLHRHHPDCDADLGSGRRREKRRVQGSRSQNPVNEGDEEDSDPLEDIIGPSQAPQASIPRGRGAASSSSGIDRRFSASYDPKSDVQPDTHPSADDWDDAVEAFRDRQKWKKQGADRLRAAGFTDDQIKKWERGGAENADADLGDFQWTKKGEKREWDRGKTVGDDGETTAEADWSK